VARTRRMIIQVKVTFAGIAGHKEPE
jgi:hypothetical protein